MGSRRREGRVEEETLQITRPLLTAARMLWPDSNGPLGGLVLHSQSRSSPRRQPQASRPDHHLELQQDHADLVLRAHYRVADVRRGCVPSIEEDGGKWMRTWHTSFSCTVVAFIW